MAEALSIAFVVILVLLASAAAGAFLCLGMAALLSPDVSEDR